MIPTVGGTYDSLGVIPGLITTFTLGPAEVTTAWAPRKSAARRHARMTSSLGAWTVAFRATWTSSWYPMSLTPVPVLAGRQLVCAAAERALWLALLRAPSFPMMASTTSMIANTATHVMAFLSVPGCRGACATTSVVKLPGGQRRWRPRRRRRVVAVPSVSVAPRLKEYMKPPGISRRTGHSSPLAPATISASRAASSSRVGTSSVWTQSPELQSFALEMLLTQVPPHAGSAAGSPGPGRMVRNVRHRRHPDLTYHSERYGHQEHRLPSLGEVTDHRGPT